MGELTLKVYSENVVRIRFCFTGATIKNIDIQLILNKNQK